MRSPVCRLSIPFRRASFTPHTKDPHLWTFVLQWACSSRYILWCSRKQILTFRMDSTPSKTTCKRLLFYWSNSLHTLKSGQALQQSWSSWRRTGDACHEYNWLPRWYVVVNTIYDDIVEVIKLCLIQVCHTSDELLLPLVEKAFVKEERWQRKVSKHWSQDDSRRIQLCVLITVYEKVW